jgi:predicted SnoaL-like aldol condensation-catalyzing enzyme
MARPDASNQRLEEVMAEQNKKRVHEIYDLTFNQHKPREAAGLYIGDQYIQHNSFVPNGAAPFVEYFEGYFKDHSKSQVVFSHLIAEGSSSRPSITAPCPPR